MRGKQLELVKFVFAEVVRLERGNGNWVDERGGRRFSLNLPATTGAATSGGLYEAPPVFDGAVPCSLVWIDARKP